MADTSIPTRAKLFLTVMLLFDSIGGWVIYNTFYSTGFPESLSAEEHCGLLVLLLFNFFAVGWILEAVWLNLFGHRLEPDVMRFGQDGSMYWARFPRLGPIKFTLGVMLAVTFVLIFPVVLLRETMSPSDFVYIWKGLALLAGAVLAGKAIWNRVKPSTAIYDPALEELSVPGGPVLRRSQITDWEVEEISGKAEKPLYFRPVLHYRDAGGVVQKAAFVTLSSREESYRFCDWLVQHLKLDGLAPLCGED